jgi:hypothetical protein
LEGKVLLIDFDAKRKDEIKAVLLVIGNYLDYFCKAKIELVAFIKEIDLHTEDLLEKAFDQVVESSRDTDMVIIHFGTSVKRSDGKKIINRLKTLGVKVLVESVSNVLFEKADLVFDSMDPKLLQKVGRLYK